MSAHSYGRSSLASPAAVPGGMSRVPAGRVLEAGRSSGSHVYESSSSTSLSEAESRDRREARGRGGGGGGLPGGVSFASSHYTDVYGDTSTAGSRTPSQAVENYFSEQPSGRNLLHVLPQGSSRGDGGGDLEQASPAPLGTYAEQPSGRGLVRDQSGSDVDGGVDYETGDGDSVSDGRGEGTVLSSPSEQSERSEGSSAWNDTDAQSTPPSRGDYLYSGGGGPRRAAAAFASSSYASDSFASTGTAGVEEGAGAWGASRSPPVVREVEVYEDDLAVSEGTESDLRMNYGGGAAMAHRGGFDTAAGDGSVASSFTLETGASGATDSRIPGGGRQEQLRPPLHGQQVFGSSGSSIASRVLASNSELGSSRQAIPLRDSWRNSPVPGGAGSAMAVERMLSGETTDSSVLDQQMRDRLSSPGQEDGDFGAVWLANRAHVRQFDAGRQEEK